MRQERKIQETTSSDEKIMRKDRAYCGELMDMLSAEILYILKSSRIINYHLHNRVEGRKTITAK